MSAEKSTWEKNQVGPYQILRKLKGVATAEVVGRVYAAVQQPSGRPALVVRPVHPEQWHPESEWRLRVRTGTPPLSYVALEVERAPQGKGTAAQLAEGMDVLAAALEGVERHAEAAAHLASAPVLRKGPARSQTPLLLAVAVGAIGCMLVLPRALGTVAPEAPAEEERTRVAEEALSEPEALPVAGMEGRAQRWHALGLDMPPGPFRGQYRVDKDGRCKGKVERPINGGCWIRLGDLTPPCGADAYEWKGGCYLPSMPAAKEPSSTLPPRTPPAPAKMAE